jgi:hypothetical protein
VSNAFDTTGPRTVEGVAMTTKPDNTPPDFTRWERENLNRVAFDLWTDNKRLREENKLLRDAWRSEVAKGATNAKV